MARPKRVYHKVDFHYSSIEMNERIRRQEKASISMVQHRCRVPFSKTSEETEVTETHLRYILIGPTM